jgi:SAM-dependent methyltransferase
MEVTKGAIAENSLAKRYDDLHRIPTEAAQSAKSFPRLTGGRLVVSQMLEGLKGNLLDLGCGRGELLLQSPDHFDLKVGIDFSEFFLQDALEFTRKYCNYPEKVSWLLHDLNEPIPYASEHFHVAVSTECIEHTFDVFGLFREVHRLLKPGGVFIFSVPNIAYIRHRFRLLWGLQPVTASSMPFWWRDYWDGTHIHYFTLPAIEMLLKQTGFVFVSNTGSGRLRRLRLIRPTLLCGDLIVTARKPT